MRDFIEIMLLSVSANLDTLVMAMAYGLNHMKISALNGIIISIITGLGTFVSILMGIWLSALLPGKLPSILGGLLLIIMGVFLLIPFLKVICSPSRQSAHIQAIPKENIPNELSKRDLILLSGALALNNLGIGIAAGISCIPAGYTTLCTFIVTLLFLWLGMSASKILQKKQAGKRAALLAAILLIVLGIIECFS